MWNCIPFTFSQPYWVVRHDEQNSELAECWDSHTPKSISNEVEECCTEWSNASIGEHSIADGNHCMFSGQWGEEDEKRTDKEREEKKEKQRKGEER